MTQAPRSGKPRAADAARRDVQPQPGTPYLGRPCPLRRRVRRLLQVGPHRTPAADLRPDRRPAGVSQRSARRVRRGLAPLAQGLAPGGPRGVGAAARLAARPAPPLRPHLPPRPQARPRDPRHARRARQAAAGPAQGPAPDPADRRLDGRHGSGGGPPAARGRAAPADGDVAVRDEPRGLDDRHPPAVRAPARARVRRPLATGHHHPPRGHRPAPYPHGRRARSPPSGRWCSVARPSPTPRA